MMARFLEGGIESSSLSDLSTDLMTLLDMFFKSDKGRPPTNGPISSATLSFQDEG